MTDLAGEPKHFEAAKGTDTKETLHEAPADQRATQDVPHIRSVGLPRTGTTLVDRILSSHSRVTSAGELNVFAELVIKGESGTLSNLVSGRRHTARSTENIDFASHTGREYLERTRELARGRPVLWWTRCRLISFTLA